MSAEQETTYFNQIKYIGLEKSAYDSQFTYAAGETPEDRLNLLLSNPDSLNARVAMTKNVRLLNERLDQANEAEENPSASFDKHLITLVRQIALDSTNSLPDSPAKFATLRFLDSLNQPGQLLNHLGEAGDSTVAFFSGMRNEEGKPPAILSSRELALMEFIGRTHDICKLLGGINAQIDPDHEIIYKEIVGKHLAGKSFITISGETIIFTAADANFITSVVGAHEDIWRESDFANESISLKSTDEEPTQDISISRARSLLHIIDIFGSAVRFENGQLKIVDNEAFNARFIDLFRRHLRLPIIDNTDGIMTDWSRGKVFRPQWGQHGVAGLTWTLGLLSKEWGINVDPNLIHTVHGGIVGVLREAESTIVGVRAGEPNLSIKPGVSPDETELELTMKLQAIRSTITAIQSEPPAV